MANIIVHYADGLKSDGHTFTLRETCEVYNALCGRVRELEESLAVPELPTRVREALTQSLTDCKKLVEVFE